MNASSTPPRREGVRFARLLPLLLGLGCLAACIAVIVLALLPTPDFSPPVDVDEEFEQRARSFEQSFASEFTLSSFTVWGRLDPEWVKSRAKQVADAEAARLPAPK